jgi:uncharacterized protein
MFNSHDKFDLLLRSVFQLLVALAIILVLLCPYSQAQIYRWQDADGHWHFSDSPTSADPVEQQPEAESKPMARQVGDLGGLFWRISKNGVRSSYLLGTIHSSDPRLMQLRPAVADALDETDRFVMEMEMDSSALLQFGTAILLTGGNDLQSLLGASLFQKVVGLMADYGMPEPIVRQLKPWVVMALLSMPKPTGGVILDMALHQRARSQGKPTSGLESMQEQLAVFEGLSMSDQITLLKKAAAQYNTLPQMFEQLIQAYLADDLAQIAALASRYQSQSDPETMHRFMSRLNDERNQRMLIRILPYLQQGNVFFAVGALHLAGPRGLVRRLRREGYKLETIR